MDWLLKLFSRLPLRFLQVVGAGIGGLTFKLSPATRARAMENLKLAGYDDPHLYERVGRNAGRQRAFVFCPALPRLCSSVFISRRKPRQWCARPLTVVARLFF